MNNPNPTSESADAILAESAPKAPRIAAVTDRSKQLAAAAARTAIANNGTDVLVLDVCDQTALFDYFVIATGTSRRQLHAISEEIDDALQKGLGDVRMGIEGYEDSRWIVLDYGSIVIHLFDEEARAYYDLESLWADAKVVPLTELGLTPAEISPRTKS
jgi:ribosome-associated protein